MTAPARAGSDWSGEHWAAVAETHSAVVFFAGERAWKLKKPVDLGFPDFSTPEGRAVACERETELNRRFAPGEYLGVAEVLDPAGRVCDHLVMMRRMPAARRLSTMVRNHEPVTAMLHQVARILAAQHARAPRGPQITEQGTCDALRGRWADNLAQTRQLLELPRRSRGAGASADEIERLACRFLAGRAPLFDRRIQEGRIVDGHGDLLADDIFCLDDGPRILDCLDFDDRLRWVDGVDDAAFLAMDLERLRAPALAHEFMSAYAEFSADPAPPSLWHHYIAYRAFVRAKAACLQEDGWAAAEAAEAADLALRHLRAGSVKFVLVGGLPGTGKSSLAGTVADRLGFTVLSSDRIRKELAGVPAEADASAPYAAGIYSPEWTERTYAELLRRAVVLLAHGESVVADASFTSAQQRDAAVTASATVCADLVQIRCAASRDLAAARLRARRRGTSDADPGIAAQMEAAADPWPEAIVIETEGGGIDTGRVPALRVKQVLETIHPDDHQYAERPPVPYMLPG